VAAPDYIDRIQKAASLLMKANCAVAFTGAGISTPSGIPDFRSARTGLWKRYDAMESASIASFLHHPERFYNWLQPLAKDIVQAQPNPAHLALARLEAAGKLAGVVTQNIDNLHHLAGSKTIFEIHGHLRESVCVECRHTSSDADQLARFALEDEIPRCKLCGSRMKPAVVLFGEPLPEETVQQALSLLSQADLVLVAGSSLVVAPASYFPMEAIERGASLVIVNLEETPLDPRADVLIRMDVAEALPAITREVLGGSKKDG